LPRIWHKKVSSLNLFCFRSLAIILHLSIFLILILHKPFLSTRVKMVPRRADAKMRHEGATHRREMQPVYINYEGISRMQAAGPGPTSPLLSSRAMKFSSCRGPQLTGYARSCETVSIYSPTNLSRRGRRGASNKSSQKREKVVGPPTSSNHAPTRRRDETHDRL